MVAPSEMLNKALKTAVIGLTAMGLAAEGKTPAQATAGKLDNHVDGPRDRNTLVVNSNPDANNTNSPAQSPETALNPNSLKTGNMYDVIITQDLEDGGYAASGQQSNEAIQALLAKINKPGTHLTVKFAEGAFIYTDSVDGTFVLINGDFVQPVKSLS